MYVNAAELPWFKLPERNAESSAPMLAERNGGMPTQNWSSIVVIGRSSADIAEKPLASIKTAQGNIAPTPATLKIVSTEVNCNDKGTASIRNGISRIVGPFYLSLK